MAEDGQGRSPALPQRLAPSASPPLALYVPAMATATATAGVVAPVDAWKRDRHDPNGTGTCRRAGEEEVPMHTRTEEQRRQATAEGKHAQPQQARQCMTSSWPALPGSMGRANGDEHAAIAASGGGVASVPDAKMAMRRRRGQHRGVVAARSLREERQIYASQPTSGMQRDRASTKKLVKRVRALDPLLHRMQNQQLRATEQEHALAQSLEMNVDRLAKRIPLSFLRERNHHALLTRTLLRGMCDAFARQHRHALALSFAGWYKYALTRRILLEQARQHHLLRHTSLAHACAIVQRRLRDRVRSLFMHWRWVVSGIRLAELRQSVSVIERWWRYYVVRQRVTSLAGAYRALVFNTSAICIQCGVRCMLARREVTTRARFLREEGAAKCLQRGYRRFVCFQMGQRNRMEMGAISMQRCWRGARGREMARHRRLVCEQAVKRMYTTIWRPRAIQWVCHRHILAIRIQRCYRVSCFRTLIGHGLDRAYQRRRFVPVCRLRRAWCMYRDRQLALVLAGAVFRVMTTHHTAVRRIQQSYRPHRQRRLASATRVLISVFRWFQAKRVMTRQILHYLNHWAMQDLSKWCASLLHATSKWRNSLLCEQERLVAYRRCQREEAHRLNVQDGLHLILRFKIFKQEFIRERAATIQHTWRIHRLRRQLAELKHATCVLQRALPQCYRQLKQRRKMRRVVTRWRRTRFICVKTHFAKWKQARMLTREAHDLNTTTGKVRKARWFQHHHLRKSMFQRWVTYVGGKRHRRQQQQKATGHAQVLLKRNTWRAWNKQALPWFTTINVLQDATSVLVLWSTWREMIRERRKSKLALAYFRFHLKQYVLQQWKADVQSFNENIDKARRLFSMQLCKNVFSRFHRHVIKMKKVDAFFNEKHKQYAIRRWVLHMCYTRHGMKQNLQGQCFGKNRLLSSHWTRWVKHVHHQRKQRATLCAMDRYYALRRLSKIVAHWHTELVPLWKDYHFITSIAVWYHAHVLQQRIFQNGFAKFWVLTAGMKRTMMATRIQKAFRSKRARRKILKLRFKFRYQLESRFSSGIDLHEYDPLSLMAAMRTHVWVFVLVNLPWEPIDASIKVMFQKVATSWTHLRKENMAFGLLDATSTFSLELCSSNKTDRMTNATQNSMATESTAKYSAVGWFGIKQEELPCIVGFWQGTGRHVTTSGAALLQSDRPLRRRFQHVCSEHTAQSTPPLVFRMNSPGDRTTQSSRSSPAFPTVINWIESVHHFSRDATTTDLQSYVRGFLVRRHIKRYRIIQRERQIQHIRAWLYKLKLKWLAAKDAAAARVLQRWIRDAKKRRLFWIRLREEMKRYQQSAVAIQRSFRVCCIRKQVLQALTALLATPTRYSNAPLCENCYCIEMETHTFSLARLRCLGCSRMYCTECARKTHSAGNRLQHIMEGVDFLVLNLSSALVCASCEVRGATRLCATCPVNEQEISSLTLCSSCFEVRHSDPPVLGGHRRSNRKWWQSKRFRSHHWSKLQKEHVENYSLLQSSSVMIKHGWISYASAQRRLEDQATTADALQQREEKLLAIRVQQEAILRDAFDRFDADKSGAIDRNEFKRMFKEELCQPLSDAQVDAAMATMDTSGNGLIEFDELLSWFAADILDSTDEDKRGSAPLTILKEALRAKRQMRRYKEKLNEFVPSMTLRRPHEAEAAINASSPARPKVPGFPSVDALTHTDFAHKRRVFFRFLHEICHLEWIFEDEQVIPITNVMEMFDTIFVPRWNSGQLTYDFYFDEESFEFNGESWQRRWDAEAKKYFFFTTRVKSRAVETHNESSGQKKKKKKTKQVGKMGADEAVHETVEDIVEVREAIDPRRKELLMEEAKDAFAKADTDSSGFIDNNEFYRMLNAELCEPISKSKARQVIAQLDVDGSGRIDFHEFFQWYATEKCQDYPQTPQIERAKALLKTKRRASATVRAAIESSVSSGSKLRDALNRRLREQQLRQDCKNAPHELIALLQDGFTKPLATKALSLHNQDVEFARQWLLNKQRDQQEAEDKLARTAAEAHARKLASKRLSAQKRRQKLAAVRKKLKAMVIGPSKRESHSTRVQQALQNLDRDLLRVERQLTTKF